MYNQIQYRIFINYVIIDRVKSDSKKFTAIFYQIEIIDSYSFKDKCIGKQIHSCHYFGNIDSAVGDIENSQGAWKWLT